MATNTIRPGQAGPPRANTVRPRPALEVVPTNAPAADVVAPPVPVAVAAPTPPRPAPAPTAAPGDGPRRQPRPGPTRLTADEATAQAQAWQQTRTATTATGWSLFSLLDRFTGLDGLFREGLPVRYLPKLLFVMLLTLLYIGNTHYGNRMNRSIQRIKQEVEDLRADYTTLKSDYMEASKQSEVARKVAALGLVESSSPPFRIEVPAGRLDEAELDALPVLTPDSLAARAARAAAAQARADSIEGRVRRLQLGLPTQDDTDEAGAPPPGLAPAVSAGAAGNAPQEAENRVSEPRTQPDGIKKYKKAPVAKHTGNGKAAASPKRTSR